MTSAPFTSDASDADDHPDVAEISALMEGAAAPERAADIRAHLDGCELCTDVRSALAEIRDSLGTLPGPARMPADIAGRIDAALAAEALLGGTHAEGGEGERVSRETRPTETAFFAGSDWNESPVESAQHGEPGEPGAGRPSTIRARHTAHRPPTSPAVVSRETGGPRPSAPGPHTGHASGHPVGTTGPGRNRPSRRPRRFRTSILSTAGAIAVLGIGGLIVNSLQPSNPSGTTSQGGTQSAQASAGADAALKHRVQHLLAGSKGSKGSATPGLNKGQKPGENPMAGGTTTVPSCIRKGIHRTENPLAVDEHAPYRDRSGYLVVLPHKGGGAGQVDAYIVDAACISGDHPGPADVLLKRTYPRR